MRFKRKQFGMSLIETAVVLGIIATLAAISVPAIDSLVKSMTETKDVESVISAALSHARAIAAKEQKYAGLRFQFAYDHNDPLKTDQYMIFIVHNPPTNQNPYPNVNDFKAVENASPIKLPSAIAVIDMKKDWEVVFPYELK